MIQEIRNMINLYSLNYVYNEKLFIQSAITTFLLRNGYDYTKFFIDEYKKDSVKALEYDNEFIIDKLEYFLKEFVNDINYAYNRALKLYLTHSGKKLKNLDAKYYRIYTTKEMFNESCDNFIYYAHKKYKKLKKLESYNIFFNIIENELYNRIYNGWIV